MFKKVIDRFRGEARRGDLVTVLDGPYANRTGTVVAVADDAMTVYIDECCQPQLHQEQVRREWRGRHIPGASRRARESDVEGVIARAGLALHDRNDTL